jgi:chromosome partitioning protein
MKTLSIFNNKGGVGKTTTAINLASAFALMLSHEAGADQEPGRVLILDMDQATQASVTLSGGFFSGEDRTQGPNDNLAGLLLQMTDRSPVELIVTTALPRGSRRNMDFIPSSPVLMANVDGILRQNAVDGLYRLQEILEPLSDLYRYTVVDNPPNLGFGALNTLVAATDVIVPIQLEGPSIYALTETLRTIESIQHRPNPSLRLLGLAPTMCNFRREEDKEWLAALQKQYGDLVLPPIPRRGEVTAALTQGLDIFSYKPPRQPDALASANLATQEFAALATEIMRRLEN